MPVGVTFNMDQMLQVSLQPDGLLKVDPAGISAPLNLQRVKIQGLAEPLAAKAEWTCFAMNKPNMGAVGPAGQLQHIYIRLTRYDFDQDAEDQIWSIECIFEADVIVINETGVGVNARFMQNDHLVDLLVTPQGGHGVQRSREFSATSVLDLQAQHPEEVRKYLAPALMRLAGKDLLGLGATDVYDAFTNIPANPSVVQTVMSLLPRLDADSSDQRDAASAELARLGAPGILAVLRLDRTTLTQEQKSRCDAFLNSERRRTFDNPDEALHDSEFLLEALNDDNPAVRVAAKNALAAVVGHPIDFDPAQANDARIKAIQTLRAQVHHDLAAQNAMTGPSTVPGNQ
jgi:hypothetical protein